MPQSTGLRPLGEAFNPAFIGAPNWTDILGIDRAARDTNPLTLLAKMRDRSGLSGFRFFSDHDPRVIDPVMNDARIAKIVLSRNPLDSYVSLEIARKTGQWRLTNAKAVKAATTRFESADFDTLMAQQRDFRDRVQRALQISGQTAFWIDYEDIADLDVVNGLARFLGCDALLAALPGKLKRQNPGTVEDKVENPDEMRAHLASLDPFVLSRSTHAEPPRGPSVPTMMIAAQSPILFLPIPGGPDAAVRDWLTALDDAPPRDGLTQKDLRPWMRKARGLVSFAVLRHPVVRAYGAFRVMQDRDGAGAKTLRRILTNQHGVDLEGPTEEVFRGFLTFLKANLNGQSALPVAPQWATQAAILTGISKAVLPHRLIREDEAGTVLPEIARRLGIAKAPTFATQDPEGLREILSDETEALCREVYRRDYLMFGFRQWDA